MKKITALVFYNAQGFPNQSKIVEVENLIELNDMFKNILDVKILMYGEVVPRESQYNESSTDFLTLFCNSCKKNNENL